MIAVVGASGVVGRILLKFLNSPIALASSKSVGVRIPTNNGYSTVKNLSDFDFKQCRVVFFVCGSEVSKQYVPLALKAGCIVIDGSSYYRMHKDIPLIIPEINAKDIGNHQLIASPNCTVTPLLMALKPLDHLFSLKEVFVASYQAVSGAGKQMLEQLDTEINDTQEYTNHDKKIAFNAIPFIDDLLFDGSTKEEKKMHNETQKILNRENVMVTATCVRIPVKTSHSLAATARFAEEVDLNLAVKSLKEFPGVHLVDCITPRDAAGKTGVFISRVRKTNQFDLSFWIVCDNLLKGAAFNMFQIFNYIEQKKLKNVI